MGRWTGKSCRLSTMMAMTSFFFLVEIVVGYLTNSIALIADSFHMLSDLVALVVGLASVKISKKKTKYNTYGWQRAEVLGALVNSVFLLALCFSIMVESLKRVVELERVESPLMMLAVGALGLLVNLFGLCLFGGHGHSHGGGESHGHSHGGGQGHSHSHDGDEENKVQTHCHDDGQLQQNHLENGHDKEINGKMWSPFRYDVDPKIMSDADLKETKCLMASEVNPTHATNCSNIINNNGDKNIIINNCNNSLAKKNGRECHNDKEIYPADDADDKIEIEIEKSPHSSSSLNMRGVFLHVLGDALGSVVVIISGLAIWLVEGEWKYYLDPSLSIAIVGIILYTTVPLFKETAHILLQAVPQDVCVEGITKQILEIEGVTGVHECHIWHLSGRRFIASAHVHCRDLCDYMTLACKIKAVFHRAGIHSTTIQPEVDKDNSVMCSLQCPELGGHSCFEHTCCRIRSTEK